VLLVGVVGAGIYFWQASSPQQTNFRTAKVERGPLTATIGATGTIEPEDVVDVPGKHSDIFHEAGARAVGAYLSAEIDRWQRRAGTARRGGGTTA